MFDTEIMMKKIKEDNDNTIPRTDELTFIVSLRTKLNILFTINFYYN